MFLLLTLAMGITTLLTSVMITLWLFLPLQWFLLSRYERPDSLLNHLGPLTTYHHAIDRGLSESWPWLHDAAWELLLIFFVVILVTTTSAMIATTRAKMRRLREAGGVGVADAMGGIRVSAESYRPDEATRRAIHVVHELALAAKIPPPQVYLLHDEPGINAFAVGLSHRDLVIGLTDGAVRQLNREQLQAVVAHEFAHIVNGDTRTNVLLMGYLHGIMGIVITAQSLIHNGVELLVKSISHGGQGITGIFVTIIGGLLWPIGLVGLIVATIVKAAYSRQREYLADAYAIEFVRNDVGLVHAFRRILTSREGSRLRSPQSLALSHAFFANGCSGIFGVLDSHPPLTKRIQAIDAGWDGELLHEDEHEVADFDGVFRGTMSIAQQAREASCGRLAESDVSAWSEPVVAHETTMDVMQHASDLRAEIPSDLWGLTQELPGSEAIVFALWAGGQLESREDDVELTSLGATCTASRQVADALVPHLEHYGLAHRLMLFDAAVNQLRSQADSGQLDDFCDKARVLLEEANDGDLLRWSWRQTLGQIVQRVERALPEEPRYADVDEIPVQAAVVLSALAYANDSTLMEQLAMQRAANLLGLELRLLPKEVCCLEDVDVALEAVQQLAPKARRKFLLACSTCVESDSLLNEEEALLMRGICSRLGYPPATLLPGQPVALG